MRVLGRMAFIWVIEGYRPDATPSQVIANAKDSLEAVWSAILLSHWPEFQG